MMNKCIITTVFSFLIWSAPSFGQNIVFNFPDTIVGPNQSISLGLSTKDFINIGSAQFSIRWDVNIMEYVDFEPLLIENVGIGDIQANDGILRFSWFSNTAESVSFPDESNLINLNFQIIGAAGDSTNIDITDEPLLIQVSQEQGDSGNYVFIDLVQEKGKVKIISTSDITLISQDISCAGSADGSIDLNAPDLPLDAIFNWTGPNMFMSNEEDLSDLEAGTYNLVIQDVEGNTLWVNTIIINEPDTLVIDEIAIDVVDCEEGMGTAAALVQGGTAPYTYEINGESNESGQFEGLSSGIYTMIVTDVNDCMTSDTFSLSGGEAPELLIQGDFDICPGEIAVLDAGIHQSYIWSTGEDTPTIFVLEPGTYSVTVDDGLPCTASAEVEVVPGGDLQITVMPDFAELCPGEEIQLIATGGDMIEWIDTSSTLSATDISNPLATPFIETTYTIIASNACASDTIDYTLFVLESEANAGPDTCILAGKELQFHASGGVIYQWEEAKFPVSDPIAPNPIATPLDSTFYIVNITDENNCIIRDTVFVAVVTEPEEIRTYNLLTPNGDGKNDILEFDGLGKFTENTLRVFNRWGNLVYDKVNYQDDNERFDGTYKGKELPAGTYFYVLKLRSGEIREAFTIVRE